MRLRMAWYLFIAMTAAGWAQTPGPTPKPTRPIPAIEHVLIISIDGLRPDRLLLADTPVLHGLIKSGAYTFWAKTTATATTLPSHISMLTAVTPRKHGIEWNDDLPLKEPVFSKHPAIFEMAHQAGYTTAMVAGKPKFKELAKPGTLDYVFVQEKLQVVDAPTCDEAVRVITHHKPDVLFVHLPATDETGHTYGWGSGEQLAAIAQADECVGRLLAALEQAGVRSSTLVIVTSDHGGAGKTHGPDDPRSRHIPWIASGPGVKAFYDLTQNADLEVRTEDTCATAAWVLGLPMLPRWDGRPVLAAFENPPAP
jgi:predicted AlkP superfamily pyrophosphatase or phosphodiesterase